MLRDETIQLFFLMLKVCNNPCIRLWLLTLPQNFTIIHIETRSLYGMIHPIFTLLIWYFKCWYHGNQLLGNILRFFPMPPLQSINRVYYLIGNGKILFSFIDDLLSFCALTVFAFATIWIFYFMLTVAGFAWSSFTVMVLWRSLWRVGVVNIREGYIGTVQ